MIHTVRSDLLPFLQHLVGALTPYAESNFVILQNEYCLDALEINYQPVSMLSDMANIICKVITFTPQHYKVILKVPQEQNLENGIALIQIINTGACLDYLEKSISNGVSLEVIPCFSGKDSTVFNVHVPIELVGSYSNPGDLVTSNSKYHFPSFYEKFSKRLHSYYSNLKNLENAADTKSKLNGSFLRKINAVILANLDRDNFDIAFLSKAMALSRSQLYRRLKPLVLKSPSHYIRYVRLQKAKEILENSDMTIGEISFGTGFVNQSYFTRIFKDQFGFNPSDMRLNKENNQPKPEHIKKDSTSFKMNKL